MNLRKFLLPGLGATLALAAWLVPVRTTGASAVDPATVAALQELQAQQLLIAGNQAKIDAQLALVTEDMRLARIFVARSGGKK